MNMVISSHNHPERTDNLLYVQSSLSVTAFGTKAVALFRETTNRGVPSFFSFIDLWQFSLCCITVNCTLEKI